MTKKQIEKFYYRLELVLKELEDIRYDMQDKGIEMEHLEKVFNPLREARYYIAKAQGAIKRLPIL